MELIDVYKLVENLRRNIGEVIVGKTDTVDLLLVSLLANGHVLLEDVPGTGKTLLAKSLARSLGGTFKRVQFTPDLLPSDLSGINFYNQKTGDFVFRPGPVFANVLLADEINRATPRTQSSLLECMEERQVTIDGVTHTLEKPFLVLATQNPVDNQGTFPLPEAQLDRFMMKVRMGYPTFEEGLDVLRRFKASNPIEELAPVASSAEIAAAQQSCTRVHIGEELLGYILRLAEATRNHPDVALGVSPRGSQALLKAVQARAVLKRRDYVSPDDIKALAVPVFSHRMLLQHTMRLREHAAEAIIGRLLESVSVPSESFS